MATTDRLILRRVLSFHIFPFPFFLLLSFQVHRPLFALYPPTFLSSTTTHPTTPKKNVKPRKGSYNLSLGSATEQVAHAFYRPRFTPPRHHPTRSRPNDTCSRTKHVRYDRHDTIPPSLIMMSQATAYLYPPWPHTMHRNLVITTEAGGGCAIFLFSFVPFLLCYALIPLGLGNSGTGEVGMDRDR
ncbi:hypothetical protein VTI74DRAFT_5541 [Chaetomium olivicolor]